MRKWCTVDLPMVCTCYAEDVCMICSWAMWALYVYDAHIILHTLLIIRLHAHGMHMLHWRCAHRILIICTWYAYVKLYWYVHAMHTLYRGCAHDMQLIWALYVYDTHMICACDALLIFPSYGHVIPRMCAWYVVNVRTVSLWYVMLLYAHAMHCWCFHGIYMLYRGCAHGM